MTYHGASCPCLLLLTPRAALEVARGAVDVTRPRPGFLRSHPLPPTPGKNPAVSEQPEAS